MYVVTPYVAQALHDSRIRDAVKNADHFRTVRELSEPAMVADVGLAQRISRWFRRNELSRENTRDVRRAHAI